MSFWETVKEGLKKATDESWDIVKEGARKTAEKAEDMARTARRRYQIHSLHRDAEKKFTEIGGRVYDMASPPWENPFLNPEIRSLIDEIKAIEAKIERIKEGAYE